MNNKPVMIYLDTETTSLNTNGAILELFFQERDGVGTVVAQQGLLFSARDDAVIEPMALQVNGMDPAKLKADGFKTFEQQVPLLRQWLTNSGSKRNVVFVGWNVSFDIKHIVAGIRRSGDEELANFVASYPQIDAKKVTQAKLKQVRGGVPSSYRLGSVIDYMAFDVNKFDGAHSARGDVQRVIAILKEIENKSPFEIYLLKGKWWLKRMFARRRLLEK